MDLPPPEQPEIRTKECIKKCRSIKENKNLEKLGRTPKLRRREEGKKGRREEGKKGRREEGKKGRREEGKKGRREEGKKA
ncbi:hypothetical protein MTR80_08470 [Alcaligenes aquatilis]|uniref:Uncharacterized protein n=1 Tax=Alcaligenes aquatilis TaxID=323284 RepID=A0ABY4NLX3_9BURK|nr:hypothetical protein [Alcaligenes aquatilis]UQN37992.1 hypothetical protein MTR80_08470 [Alcaligenes aquatilis]